MPLQHDACVFHTLEMGGGAIVRGVINTEAPPAILPQGAIPFSVVRFLVTALETIGEGGVLAFSFAFVLGYGTQFEAIFAFDVTPLIFWGSLCCMDTWEEG